MSKAHAAHLTGVGMWTGTTTDADGRRGSRFGVTRVYGADVNARVDPSASVEDISQGQRSSDHGARVPEARRPSENGTLLLRCTFSMRQLVWRR